MRLYLVGGMVRDNIMGRNSKDADFSVVLDDLDKNTLAFKSVHSPFEYMKFMLEQRGFKIFVETPEHLTIRAQFPKGDNRFGVRDADFVLARKEGEYTDGRRPDSVEVGTLEDDLARRDLTMNAIAQAEDGTLIDPFNGQQDIDDQVIRAVGKAFDRLSEDALRAVRALRFHVVTGFRIDKELEFAMTSAAVLDAIVNKISDERIKDELHKMFVFSTMDTLMALHRYPALTAAMFAGRVNLDSTLKQMRK